MRVSELGLGLGMDVNTPGDLVVKEFRFFPESHIVTIVFADDTTAEFQGTENYHKARHACLDHPQPDSRQVELQGAEGKTVTLTVPKDTPHETFEA